MNGWVTIASFTYPHELAILRGRLESEGIECNTKDENTISANPFYSNAIGGVKIQVRESDAGRAALIAADYFNRNTAEADNITPQQEYKPEEPHDSRDKILCPVCGSAEVHADKTPSRFNIVMLLLIGLPLLIPGRKKYHCFNCGADFKKK
ncbi:MAG: DUF2007 domain-containing protein [Bacteroidia bacterium]|jgi:DNA-directed RNA polymerase subunit RPC12/RpoP|nr:DUF2007 domain-containing protein [Bacteroidia bacterium]